MPDVFSTTLLIIGKTPTGFLASVWPTMHTNSLLAIVEAVLVLTVVETIAPLLKERKALFLHRAAAGPEVGEHQIWRNSTHHGHGISRISVASDRMEAEPVNQRLKISDSTNLCLQFLNPMRLSEKRPPSFRIES